MQLSRKFFRKIVKNGSAGIVFDTCEYVGATSFFWSTPLDCQVSFSIPVVTMKRKERENFSLLISFF